MSDHIYTPNELRFDVGTDPDLGSYAFIIPIDPDSEEADRLGHHNVTGLPDCLGVEDMECTWSTAELTTDELKAELIAAGFTYEQMFSDE